MRPTSVLHQVRAASVMISSHTDISAESLQHLPHGYISFAVMIESFTLAVMVKSRLSVGSTPDTCIGDVLHLVRVLVNLRTHALVMILTLRTSCVSSHPSGSCSRCGDDPLLVGLLGHLLDHLEHLVADGYTWENVLESAVS